MRPFKLALCLPLLISLSAPAVAMEPVTMDSFKACPVARDATATEALATVRECISKLQEVERQLYRLAGDQCLSATKAAGADEAKAKEDCFDFLETVGL